MIYYSTSESQAAQLDQLLHEIATLRRKLDASQELAAHRGHSLALTLEENRRLRAATAQRPCLCNALAISSEVVRARDYTEAMTP